MAGGRKSKVRQYNNRNNITTTPLQTNTSSISPTTNNILSTLTKEQLKIECRRRGQKTTGNKMQLLQRLGGQRMTNSNATGNNTVSTIKQKIVTVNGSKQINHSKKTQGMSRASTTRAAEREERENLVLWKSPLKTLQFAALELIELVYSYGKTLFYYRNRVLLILTVFLALTYTVATEENIKFILWCLYWVGLGVLSSVGFGTGLHTFILYLGPHIAKVTLAAYECNALNFPSPPYPDQILCPKEPDLSNPPSILSIMSKVRLEAMLWGAGTALGELPPYFMARAARISGTDLDDEDDLREFQELQRRKIENPDSLTLAEKAKTMVETLVRKVGFFGILAAASIPNPLFDLAGMTCGHFLIPFWTFFGATLIGKAIIKMHIQKLGVIIAFNEVLVEKFIHSLDVIPVIGAKLQQPLRNFFKSQKAKLHMDAIPSDTESANLVGWLFETFVLVMVLYFILSIVNSLAQIHHKKIHRKRVSKKDKKAID